MKHFLSSIGLALCALLMLVSAGCQKATSPEPLWAWLELTPYQDNYIVASQIYYANELACAPRILLEPDTIGSGLYGPGAQNTHPPFESPVFGKIPSDFQGVQFYIKVTPTDTPEEVLVDLWLSVNPVNPDDQLLPQQFEIIQRRMSLNQKNIIP